jgi:hypothetical protein
MGDDFSVSGLVIVKKMVANYNTAISQYQRNRSVEPPVRQAGLSMG